MSAYVIVDLEIIDPAGFQEYRQRVIETVKKYGGKYIAAADAVETLEGDWRPKRIVMIQFESMQSARNWIQSPVYREIAPVRHRTARTKMIVVEGT